MGSSARAIIVGNLGKEPEMSTTPSGKTVVNFTVATRDTKTSPVQWHRITAWNKTAELCKSFLAKGRSVYVEGRIEYRTYNKKDGSKGYSTDIVADRVVFLGGGKEDPKEEAPTTHAPDAPPADEDNIPF